MRGHERTVEFLSNLEKAKLKTLVASKPAPVEHRCDAPFVGIPLIKQFIYFLTSKISFK